MTLKRVCTNPAWSTNGTDQTEWNTRSDPPSLIFGSITTVPSPRECALCFHGILTVGEPLTLMNTSCADAKGSLEKVLFAFKKPNGRVRKLSIFTNKFLVFGFVTRQRYVAVSVLEQEVWLCYCHQENNCRVGTCTRQSSRS